MVRYREHLDSVTRQFVEQRIRKSVQDDPTHAGLDLGPRVGLLDDQLLGSGHFVEESIGQPLAVLGADSYQSTASVSSDSAAAE